MGRNKIMIAKGECGRSHTTHLRGKLGECATLISHAY